RADGAEATGPAIRPAALSWHRDPRRPGRRDGSGDQATRTGERTGTPRERARLLRDGRPVRPLGPLEHGQAIGWTRATAASGRFPRRRNRTSVLLGTDDRLSRRGREPAPGTARGVRVALFLRPDLRSGGRAAGRAPGYDQTPLPRCERSPEDR